jgi:UDP-N-acetylmuramate: L-alanyl-gamma-D-glutamyl-meso-diaminopimelate ligase
MTIKKIHLIAACGTGMGTLACMLQEAGYEVSGSDQNVYPPMSDFLKKKRN